MKEFAEWPRNVSRESARLCPFLIPIQGTSRECHVAVSFCSDLCHAFSAESEPGKSKNHSSCPGCNSLKRLREIII